MPKKSKKEINQKIKDLSIDIKDSIIEEFKNKYSDFRNLSNEEIEKKLKNILDKKEEYGEDIDALLKEAEKFIKKHPLLSISGAFIIGWLVSK